MGYRQRGFSINSNIKILMKGQNTNFLDTLLIGSWPDDAGEDQYVDSPNYSPFEIDSSLQEKHLVLEVTGVASNTILIILVITFIAHL